MFDPRFACLGPRRDLAKGLDRNEGRTVASASRGCRDGTRVLTIGGRIRKLRVELLAAGAQPGEGMRLADSGCAVAWASLAFGRAA